MKINIETDCKLLVPLFRMKYLDQMPPRVLWLCLRLHWWNFRIYHTSGKYFLLADALTRAPTTTPGVNNIVFTQEIVSFLDTIIVALPVSPDRLQQYQDTQSSDAICSALQEYCPSGWWDNHHLPSNIKQLSLHTRTCFGWENSKDSQASVNEVQGFIPCPRGLQSYTIPWCEQSCAELSMGWNLRTDLPQLRSQEIL